MRLAGAVGVRCHAAYIYKQLLNRGFPCFSSAPGPVASVGASPASATSVEISWTPPLITNGVLMSYHIEYQSANGSGISDNGEINRPASITSYTVTGLEENTLYHFTVSAETSAGRGERSTVSVRTPIARESL